MSWDYDMVRDELREQKQLSIGISRAVRELTQRSAGTAPRGTPKPQARPGRVLLKAAVAELLRPTSYSSGGSITFEKSAGEMGHELYPGDAGLQDWIRRAAANPATTTTVGYGAELLSSSTIDFLSGDDAASGFSQLAAQTLNVPVEGNVKVPRRAHPATLSASWTTEGAPKAVFALSLSSIQLTANKITAISCWGDEIGQWSVPAIETVVADSLRRDINGLLDSTAFGTAAASGAAPAGLFNGATSVTPAAAASVDAAMGAMMADLSGLLSAIMSGAPDARPIFVAHPAQALRIRALAPEFAEVIVSGYMSPRSVGAIDGNSVITMLGPIAFLSSSNATLHLSDTPAALAAAGATNISAPVSSAFQENLVALRSTLYCGWKLRRSGASALAVNVNW